VKTRRGVPICKVGTFPLSTGEHTFTRKQFEAAIRNAEGGTAPMIGIGHSDPRWNEVDASHDGEPALGRVESLRLSNDGEQLIGDYVDMPDWFADALPSSFPRRSLEGECKGDNLLITAVKVLGVKMPGVHTLEDLKEFVSEEGPAVLAAGADNNGHAFTIVLASQPERKVKTVNAKLMREALGLPEDATDEQVKARAKAHFDQQAAVKAAASTGSANSELVREMLGLTPDATDEEVKAKLKQKGLALSQIVAMIDPENRAEYLQAAVAEGKFSKDRLPVYEERYERDPVGTRALIASMAAVDPGLLARARARSGASSSGTGLMLTTRQTVGLESRDFSDPLFHDAAPGSPVAASDAPKAQLTRTEYGTVCYGGVPTRLSDRGSRQVFYRTEWIDVDEFERMGLKPADSAISISTTQQLGSAQSRATLNEGISPSNNLLGETPKQAPGAHA
jgi:Mu-like prophage I protein